ncbi:hypothetical protein LTR08_001392 [Meristemomyces frigidus]|nr:hypothetical protein LTR08_001392 [Meristemomyces frigidus]
MTGTLCLAAASLPKQYEPAKSLVAKLQAYKFSERWRWFFCAQCGTHMLQSDMYDGGSPNGSLSWNIATGTLEQVEGVVDVKGHGFIVDTLDGGFSDFLQVIRDKKVERWSYDLEKEETLPGYWLSPKMPKVDITPTERLHAHCKCNGINLWIARPSERSAMGEASWRDVTAPHDSDVPNPAEKIWWIRGGGKKYFAGVCTCNSCRLASGMEWVEWAFVPTIDITLDADGKIPFSRDFGTLKSYRSSERATRYFCGTCGAIVFWNGNDRLELIDVAVGLLDAAEGARAESWLEWRTKYVSYREDAMPRAESLTLAVEAGLEGYGKQYHGGQVE